MSHGQARILYGLPPCGRRPTSLKRLLGIALGAVALTGVSAGQASSTPGTVTGTVAFRQRSTPLPLDAAIDVRLEEIAAPGAAPRLVSESVLSAAGQSGPIPFQVSYEPAGIDPSHTYRLRATLTSNGTLLFTSTAAYTVLTRGAPASVAIVLQPVGGGSASSPSAPTLQGTYWKLVQIGGQPAIAGPGGEEANLLLHPDRKFTGATGCNAFSGSYSLAQSALTLTAVPVLAKMCSPEMTQQERALFHAMKATRGYRLQGNTLELRIGDEVLASFQARQKK